MWLVRACGEGLTGDEAGRDGGRPAGQHAGAQPHLPRLHLLGHLGGPLAVTAILLTASRQLLARRAAL